MDLGSPTRIKIEPNEEKTAFQFLLSFPGRQQPVEFETTAVGAMALMVALQRLQVRHKIPIPRSLRPTGRPKLVVSTE